MRFLLRLLRIFATVVAVVVAVPVLAFVAWLTLRSPTPAPPPPPQDAPAKPPADVTVIPKAREVVPPPTGPDSAPRADDVAKAPEPPAPEKPSRRIDIDDATRALFPESTFLAETEGGSKPLTSCDGLLHTVYWINISDSIRSYLEGDQVSAMEIVGTLMTGGLSLFVGPGNPYYTIFSAKTDGPYVTLLLGERRGYWDDDKTGPVRRLTYYKLDRRRLGLVEDAAADAPPLERPKKGPPKIQTVHLRCVYRSGKSNEP